MPPTRRSPYEIVIQPDVRPQQRKRIAVTALFAPDYETAAEMLLSQLQPSPERNGYT